MCFIFVCVLLLRVLLQHEGVFDVYLVCCCLFLLVCCCLVFVCSCVSVCFFLMFLIWFVRFAFFLWIVLLCVFALCVMCRFFNGMFFFALALVGCSLLLVVRLLACLCVLSFVSCLFRPLCLWIVLFYSFVFFVVVCALV